MVDRPLTDFASAYELFRQGKNENAYKAFLAAAARGDPSSQTFVGYMFQHGIGTPKNDADAEHWFRAAIDQGNSDASRYLAHLLIRRGKLIEAKQLLLDAARKGCLSAKYDLGRSELQGWFGSPNIDHAVEHLEAAVAGGHVIARPHLARAKMKQHPGVLTFFAGCWLVSSAAVLALVRDSNDPRVRT